MNFTKLCNLILSEKKQKTLSGYDYYKMIRKPTPKPGESFKDKTKYNRKEKYKKSYTESKK